MFAQRTTTVVKFLSIKKLKGVHGVASNPPPISRLASHEFATGLLQCQRCARACDDHQTLIFRESIHNPPQEQGLGAGTVAHTVRTAHHSAAALCEPLHHGGDQRVACETIPSGDQQDSSAKLF